MGMVLWPVASALHLMNLRRRFGPPEREEMAIYQHDLASTFRLQILGALRGGSVTELEHCWVTARSIMDGKELVVDLRGLTELDEAGRALLDRMRAAGARMETARTPGRSGPACSRLRALWSRRGLRPFLRGGE